MHIHTPLMYSQSLSSFADTNIYLKLDCLQPSGSFKIRGISKLCTWAYKKGYRRLVSSSGGNAGIAAAFVGNILNMYCEIIIPSTSSEMMIEKIKQQGAKVTVKGKSWDESDEYARNKVFQDNKSFYVPPFDHPLIWEGHSSIVDEVINDGVVADLWIMSVGGGGLLCGVMEGLARHKIDKSVQVWAVETDGAASFRAAIENNRPYKIDKITSIATSLGAARVAEEAFKWSQKANIDAVTVSDGDAINAAKKFAYEHRIMLEFSCSAAISSLYLRKEILKEYNRVCVIVCGGNNISPHMLV